MTGKPKIFIDGEAGTTGLQISDALQVRKDIDLIQLPYDERKTRTSRKNAINDADIVILCLPDEAAKDAVSLLENSDTTIIDASSAHRTDSHWSYGFTEYDKSQRDEIKSSKRISNPGCYAIGAVSIIHPLVSSGLFNGSETFYIHGLSGYSGGGKNLISQFEQTTKEESVTLSGYDYSLNLNHKHVPEIKLWSGVEKDPTFLPTVGPYKQGMLVHVPLPLGQIRKKVTAADIRQIYSEHYENEKFIKVIDSNYTGANDLLHPQALNGSNQLHLHLLYSQEKQQAIMVAQLDNLGKGASGQCIQTVNSLIGVEEDTGLV